MRVYRITCPGKNIPEEVIDVYAEDGAEALRRFKKAFPTRIVKSLEKLAISVGDHAHQIAHEKSWEVIEEVLD